MSLNHENLLKHCTSIFDSYDTESVSVDAHVAYYFQDEKLPEEDRIFIVEVFSGCVRYLKALDVVVKGYYSLEGKTLLLSENSLYRVLAYLTLFRLEELGMDEFQEFIKTKNTLKMYRFLKFFTDERHVLTWMKDEWSRLYDSVFVQNEILLPFQKWLPKLHKFVQRMEDIVENRVKPKKKKVPVTELKPFELTKPRPRSVPVPQPIPTMKKTRGVPKTVYEKPAETVVLDEKKVTNRRQAERLLAEANKLQPACASEAAAKSEKMARRLEEIVQAREAELDFERHKANPVPSFTQEAPAIKLNAAAILREWKLYRDKEVKEQKKLEAIESGAFDASSFLQWQESVRLDDLAKELAEVERRRLAGKLSYEEAILARRRLEETNRANVAQIKAATEEQCKRLARRKVTEEEALKALVEEVLACKENAREAARALKQKHQRIVKEIKEESRELHQQAQAAAKAELDRKMQVINEIRALEAAAATRAAQGKLVDQASTPGYGFLNEMSLVELNERLSMLRSQDERDREEKRDRILEDKQQMTQRLMDTLEHISRHRQEMTRVAAVRLEDKKHMRGQKKPLVEVKDEKLDDMQNRLAERKAERLSQQKKEKAAQQPTAQMNQMMRRLAKDKKHCAEARWAELEATEERRARLQTEGSLQSASARLLAERLAVLS